MEPYRQARENEKDHAHGKDKMLCPDVNAEPVEDIPRREGFLHVLLSLANQFFPQLSFQLLESVLDPGPYLFL